MDSSRLCKFFYTKFCWLWLTINFSLGGRANLIYSLNKINCSTPKLIFHSDLEFVVLWSWTWGHLVDFVIHSLNFLELYSIFFSLFSTSIFQLWFELLSTNHTANLPWLDFPILHILCINAQCDLSSSKNLVAFHIELLLESGHHLFYLLAPVHLPTFFLVPLLKYLRVPSLSPALLFLLMAWLYWLTP